MNVSRIFLSHSHKDNDWCSAFVYELKHYGVDVWYDKQSLYVGAKWLQTIETELEGRDTFLVVLTPNSWASDWVRDEIALALAQHKRIVSILHQTTQVSGFITTYQMLDVIGLSSVEAAKSVATSLGLSHSEYLSASESGQSTDEQYEYFEITQHRIKPIFDIHVITSTDSGQVFFQPKFGDGKYRDIEYLREVAKTKGLEELPEKGAKWYSYRFRRKKQ